jgi:hypothetical protein
LLLILSTSTFTTPTSFFTSWSAPFYIFPKDPSHFIVSSLSKELVLVLATVSSQA